MPHPRANPQPKPRHSSVPRQIQWVCICGAALFVALCVPARTICQPNHCQPEIIASTESGFRAWIGETTSGEIAVVWRSGWDRLSRWGRSVPDTIHVALRQAYGWTIGALLTGAPAQTYSPVGTPGWEENSLWVLLPTYSWDWRAARVVVAAEVIDGRIGRLDTLENYSEDPICFLSEDGRQYGIVRLSAGRMLAYWTRLILREVQVAYYDGKNWSKPRPLAPAFTLPGYSDAADVFRSEDGTLHAVFRGIPSAVGASASSIDLYYTRLTNGDTSWSEPVLVAARSVENQPRNTRICRGRDGRIHIFWIEEKSRYTFRRDKLYYSYSDDGISWSEPALLARNPDATLLFRMAEVDLSDQVHLIWGEYSWVHKESIAYFHRRGSGQTWSPTDTLAGLSQRVRMNSAFLDESDTLHTLWLITPPGKPIAEAFVKWLKYCRWYADETPSSAGSTRRVPPRLPFRFDFQVYPNPASNGLTILIPGLQVRHALLSISNVAGEIVWQRRVNVAAHARAVLNWACSDSRGLPVPNGLYLVRLEAGGQVATRKVVLVR